MSVMWSTTEGAQSAEEERIFRMARRTYLSTLLLVALVNCVSVMIATTGPMPILLRVLNYTVAIYGVGVLIYATIWIARTMRYRRERVLASTNIDSQTGLLNWDGLSHALREVQADGRGERVELGFLYVDIGGLDRINIRHGQPAGDEVLRNVAKFLSEEAPEGATVGRVGGNEFLAMLPGSAAGEAGLFADYLVRKMREGQFASPLVIGTDVISARVKVVPHAPEQQGLTELLASVRKAISAPRTFEGLTEGGPGGFYPVPEVTLGAVACFAWDKLPESTRREFDAWRTALQEEFTNTMRADIGEVLALRAEPGQFDFVTAAPLIGEPEKEQAVRVLAESVAEGLGVPFREVLVDAASSTITHHYEPSVAAFVEKGSSVLLIDDLMESQKTLRLCVEKLSASGVFVQVLGWAAKSLSDGQ